MSQRQIIRTKYSIRATIPPGGQGPAVGPGAPNLDATLHGSASEVQTVDTTTLDLLGPSVVIVGSKRIIGATAMVASASSEFQVYVNDDSGEPVALNTNTYTATPAWIDLMPLCRPDATGTVSCWLAVSSGESASFQIHIDLLV